MFTLFIYPIIILFYILLIIGLLILIEHFIVIYIFIPYMIKHHGWEWVDDKNKEVLIPTKDKKTKKKHSINIFFCINMYKFLY